MSYFIKKSVVKDYVTAKGLRSSTELFDELENEVKTHIDRAIKRAKDNGRSTVQGRDL